MFRCLYHPSLLSCFLATLIALPQLASRTSGAELLRREWKVDGVAREALLAIPTAASDTPAPLVFCFHGHGGSMRNAARQFHLHTEWPEAICVYMQGLNTPGRLTDPEGRRPGWQHAAGDQQNRDLKFFDAVLASVRKDYRVDERRIHSTGHSNGGGFTYLLWKERSSVFASMAPSGAAQLQIRNQLSPKPLFHIAGTNDPLVKYSWQQETIETIKSRQQCGPEQPWKGAAKICPSPLGAPVATLLTTEGHKFPDAAPALIAAFFKEHPRQDARDTPGSAAQTDADRPAPPKRASPPSRTIDDAPPMCGWQCDP